MATIMSQVMYDLNTFFTKVKSQSARYFVDEDKNFT